jgi:hypothetical protein
MRPWLAGPVWESPVFAQTNVLDGPQQAVALPDPGRGGDKELVATLKLPVLVRAWVGVASPACGPGARGAALGARRASSL